MLLTPPEGFDLDVFFHDTNIFQSWEIFPGLRTTGSKDVAGTMDGLRIPRDLTGMRVLDIGPWNGFFSFECARRGATEVVSLGLADPDKITGYNKTKNLLRADNCRYGLCTKVRLL
jgi:hypothetical protein